jgi:hypothetical protein
VLQIELDGALSDTELELRDHTLAELLLVFTGVAGLVMTRLGAHDKLDEAAFQIPALRAGAVCGFASTFAFACWNSNVC